MLLLPEQAWLGRLRARLEFTRQCRVGAPEVVVQTMRPELGPRVVNLTSTFMRIDEAFDGEQNVESSVWAVQISDVSPAAICRPAICSPAVPRSGISGPAIPG